MSLTSAPAAERSPIAWLRGIAHLSWRRGMPVYLINLVWLAYPIIGAITTTSAPAAAFVIALCAVLAGIFVLSPGLIDQPLGVRLATMAVFVGVLLLISTQLAGSLHSASVYVTVMIATLFRWPTVLPILGVSVALLGVTALFNPLPYAWGVVGLAAFIGVAVAFGRHNAEMAERLRTATERNAALAAVAERERIGRDLHDILGHSLTTINVKTQLASRLVDADPATARRELAEIEQISRQALADVRATTSQLREVRVATELASARSVLAAAGIAHDLPSSVPPLPEDANEIFGYVIREGVTNVVRHAHASHCRIELDEQHVAVIDDGRGLPPGLTDATSSGLRGLRERAAEHGAVLTLNSDRNGTRLAVRREGNP